MITPLVSLKRRAKSHRISYGLPLSKKQKPSKGRQTTTRTAKSASPRTPVRENTTKIPAKMAFAGEMEVDEAMADDELVTDSDKTSVGLSEKEDEDEDVVTLQPKIPFKERADPFVSAKDEKFLKIENYFVSLLRAPNLSIDRILEGTFDSHEITLITLQPGPPDVVRWQMRNAQRYYENLETRFKGHTSTVAFKMACLYFGFPVEPLRMEMMKFLLGPDPLEENVVPNPNPLSFLDVYKEDESIHSKNILSLRGGGNSSVNEKDNTVTWNPSPRAKKRGKQLAVGAEQAIQEISPENHQMDSVFWSTTVQPPSNTMNLDNSPAPQIRLYGWQGAVDAALRYRDFVSKVDKLVSNWDGTDLSIYVDIFCVSPLKFIETAPGSIYHRQSGGAPAGDTVWGVLQKYFGNGDTKKHACFIRLLSDGKENRPQGYQPWNKDTRVIQLENTDNKDVAYMRVPSNLHAEHKAHQFSVEHMHAMQFFLLPYPPHVSVVYQDGLTGDAYQYLDPPKGLWVQFIDAKNEGDSLKKLSFKLKAMNEYETPIIIPGGSGLQNSVNRLDLRKGKTETPMVSKTLGDAYAAIKLALWNVNLGSECNGFEIWRQGTDFKNLREPPARIVFSDNIGNPKTLQDWQDFLKGLPDGGPLGFVVRPVYKAYRLDGDEDMETASVQLNELDLQNFKTLVRDQLYKYYNPNDPSQVLVLIPRREDSVQTELAIRHNTTEEEWQWIRRNIVEPEFAVVIEDIDNDWIIQEGLLSWGPRYIAKSYADNRQIPTTTSGSSFLLPVADLTDKTAPISESRSGRLSLSPIPRPANIFTQHKSKGTGNPSAFAIAGSNTANQNERGTMADTNQEALDFLFRNSKNTRHEAERKRALHSRAFTDVSSIFNNPLRPVMPLYGPPLEKIIKTGPSMPGVSIAMMTPTEMLMLQKEVHSLRSELLTRTRTCPYADCERYFTFSDGAGLDQHIREDHNILRCFLCDKNEHLLPYYNTDQIKKHFVTEHLDEILTTYGKDAAPRAEPKSTGAKVHETPDGEVREETSDEYPEDAFEEDYSDLEERERLQRYYGHDTSPSDSSSSDGSSPTPRKQRHFSEPYGGKNVWNYFADLVKRGQNPWNQLMAAKQVPVGRRTRHAEPSYRDPARPVASDRGQKLYQAKMEAARIARTAKRVFPRATLGTPSSDSADTDDDDDDDAAGTTAPARPTVTKGTQAKPTQTRSTQTEVADTRPTQAKSTQTEAVETKAAEAKPTETKPTETKTAEAKTAETKTAETEAEEAEAEETKTAATEAAETKAAETKAAETKAEETKTAAAEAGETKAEGDTTLPEPSAAPLRHRLFTAVNTTPGTNAENDEFIRLLMEEYERDGRPGGGPGGAGGGGGGGGGDDDDGGDGGGGGNADNAKKRRRRRKRKMDTDPSAVIETDDSASDIYEYSEGSAVSDSLDSVASDGPSSSKRARRSTSRLSSSEVSGLTVSELSSPETSESE